MNINLYKYNTYIQSEVTCNKIINSDQCEESIGDIDCTWLIGDSNHSSQCLNTVF
jgi:hypothetical protein